MSWKWEFGPASVLAVLAAIAQVIVFVWVMSSNYTSLAGGQSHLTEKVETYKKASDERFDTVRTAIKDSHATTAAISNDVSGMKATLNFLGVQVQRVEDKVNGK